MVIKRHWHAGRTLSEIAALSGRSRETVLRQLCKTCGLSKERVLALDAQRTMESRLPAAA